jgi:outer membrane protein assembly factor BamB
LASEGVLYVGLRYLTLALDPADGRIIWEVPLEGLKLDVGAVVVVSGYSNSLFFDRATGRLLANYAPPEKPSFYDNILLRDDKVYALDNKMLYIFKTPQVQGTSE